MNPARSSDSVVVSIQDDVEEIKTVLTSMEVSLDTIKRQAGVTTSSDSIKETILKDNDEYELEQTSDYSYKEEIRKAMNESLDEIEEEINIGVKEKIKLRFVEGVESATRGAKAGVEFAKAIPVIGSSVVAHALGAGIGAIGGFFAGIFG